jgi:hypothetical protein
MPARRGALVFVEGLAHRPRAGGCYGPFSPGADFTWHTHDLRIKSTVYQVDPQRRTLWGGSTEGITGIHSWTFTPVPGGVRVNTDESWSGEPVRAAAPDMQAGLDASLAAWLRHLSAAAKQRR